jgi:glutamate-1-semialdehyde 2,1-aminomutase
MAAGLAQLRILRETDPFAVLEARTRRLVEGLVRVIREAGHPATGGSLGSMWGIFFSDGPVRDFAGAQRADVARFRAFFHGCLDRGVFLAPSAFEAGFLSTAHGDDDIDETIDRAAEAAKKLA